MPRFCLLDKAYLGYNTSVYINCPLCLLLEPKLKTMKSVLVVFLLGLAAPFVTVGNPAYEPFANAVGTNNGTSYTSGLGIGSYLIGQTNAQGLSWAGAGTSNTYQPIIGSGNLSVSGLAAPLGNEVSYGFAGGSTGDTGRFGLGGAITSGTVYYSMILQVSALGGLNTSTAGTGGAIVAAFNNLTGSGGQPSALGADLKMRTNTLGTGGYCFGLDKTGSSVVWDSTIHNVGDTVFVVASYTFTGTPANDIVSLWINPSSATFGTANPPTALLTQASGSGITSAQIASFLLRQGSASEPNLIADEIRIGVAWADVTPPPAEIPSFSGLASPTIAFGATSVTLSGTVSATSPTTLYPNQGEKIIATINGNAQTNIINDATGDFSFSYTNKLSTLTTNSSPYTITYSYAGNGYLYSESDSSTTLTVKVVVGTNSQAITFGSLANQTYGVAPFGVSATASSGLPVSFSVGSGPATITNGTNVIITGAGTVFIVATQSGNTNYAAATPVTNSFTVNPLAVVLYGTRAFDGTAIATNSILSVANAVGSDDVNVASGYAALAGTNAGPEAITSFGTLTLGGATSNDYTLTGASGSVLVSISITNGVPAYDPFANASSNGETSYAPGSNLIGQISAQYLTWYSAGPTGNQPQPVIVPGNLSVPGLFASTGNSVSYGGNGDSARLGLGTAITNGTVYYSMAMQVTALAGLPTSGSFVAGFNDFTGSQTNAPSVAGARLELRLSGSGYNLGLDKSGSGIVWDPNNIIYNVGDTVFVVGSYSFNSETTNGDTTSLWINPDSSTFGAAIAPTASVTSSNGGNITLGQIESFLLREGSTSEPTLTVDDVRVGYTWADVTPSATITVSPFPITSEYMDNTGRNLVINWQSVPGAIYQVIGASNLNPPVTWTNVGNTITATGSNTSATNAIVPSRNFYRVESP